MALHSPSRLAEKYGDRMSRSAYEAIRDAILTYRYKPGDRLAERTLAQELGQSRTPVRHALAALASEGYVDVVPHVGVFVRRLDLAEVQELLTTRRVLEAGAAAVAAERADAATLDELDALAQTVDAISEHGRDPEVERAELAFHRRLIEATGNSEVQRLAFNVQRIFLTLALYGQSGERLAARGPLRVTHDAIAKAIRSRRPDRAFRAMWDHLAPAERILRDRLRQRES